MKRVLLAIIVIILSAPVNMRGEEGLWLPILLKEQKFSQMRKLGLKLSPEEIYSVNRACVKDAVIGLMSEGANLRSFGTASFISANGLLLTNYHVVLSYLEQFSTKENDFLKYGYWAGKAPEETLCRGLEMKQLIRMEDVTNEILKGTDGLTGAERLDKIDENGKSIAKEATKGTKYEAKMQALFGNNQYIMSIYAIYSDIRMVAAPPFAIGKFGGDSDNYCWPRHTGDFAVLRVYSDKDNNPANYSQKNIPYRPVHYFNISISGVKDGDFVMIPGFPGTTREYIPSFSLEKIIYGENATRVSIRGEKISILKNAIEENPDRKFRYTTRLSSIGNSYLRAKGEIMGVTRMDLVNKKREEEKAFQEWVNATPERTKKYGNVLSEMEKLYVDVSRYNMADLYFNEAGINGSEIVPFIGKFEKLASIYSRKNLDAKAADLEAKRLIALTVQFFNNWDYEVDRKMFRNLMFRYYDKMPADFHPEAMDIYIKKYDGDVNLLTEKVFSQSMFTDKQKLTQFLENPERDVDEKIKNDALYQLAIGYYRVNVDKIMRQRSELQAKQMELFDLYLEGVLEMNSGKDIYPDANSSLRIGYGKVAGAAASDGILYESTTTLDGANEKYLNNIEDSEFYLPKKIRELYAKKDFGRYSDKRGRLVVNFLTDAHTSGGSSGSPVLNGKGELIGLNFDRIWQGAASDYRFDSRISRSIAVDVRYILFLLDKYSQTDYVLKELTIK